MTGIRLDRHAKILFAEHGAVRLYLDIVRPQGVDQLPVILVVHGGGWCLYDRTAAGAIPPLLARHGYVAVNIDHRLAPQHPYPAAIEDVLTALQWITQHVARFGGDHKRIGAIGFSSGGHLIGLAATMPESPLSCAVAWGGTMDLRNNPVTTPYRSFPLAFLGACQHDAPQCYVDASPRYRISRQSRPLLLVHGENDSVVPLQQSIDMKEAALTVGASVDMVIVPGADHWPENPRTPEMVMTWSKIFAFYARHLANGGADAR